MNNTINCRTPEEIKKWLEPCKEANCSACFNEYNCKREAEALAYIQQLECERDEARNDLDTINYANTELHSAYEAMKRERDAAVEDLTLACTSGNPCLVCGHYRPDMQGMQKCELNEWVCKWTWRGAQDAAVSAGQDD